MTRLPVFVGLDYHQASIRACVMDQQGQVLANFRAPNDIHELIKRVGHEGCAVRATVESSTGAADLAEKLIAEAGWIVDLAHPGYVS